MVPRPQRQIRDRFQWLMADRQAFMAAVRDLPPYHDATTLTLRQAWAPVLDRHSRGRPASRALHDLDVIQHGVQGAAHYRAARAIATDASASFANGLDERSQGLGAWRLALQQQGITPSPELGTYLTTLERFVAQRLRLTQGGVAAYWVMTAVHHEVARQPSSPGAIINDWEWRLVDPTAELRRIDVMGGVHGAVVVFTDPTTDPTNELPRDVWSVIAEDGAFVDWEALRNATHAFVDQAVDEIATAIHAYYQAAGYQKNRKVRKGRDPVEDLAALARWYVLDDVPEGDSRRSTLRKIAHNRLAIDAPPRVNRGTTWRKGGAK